MFYIIHVNISDTALQVTAYLDYIDAISDNVTQSRIPLFRKMRFIISLYSSHMTIYDFKHFIYTTSDVVRKGATGSVQPYTAAKHIPETGLFISGSCTPNTPCLLYTSDAADE